MMGEGLEKFVEVSLMFINCDKGSVGPVPLVYMRNLK
jgi:hypothetical protein